MGGECSLLEGKKGKETELTFTNKQQGCHNEMKPGTTL